MSCLFFRISLKKPVATVGRLLLLLLVFSPSFGEAGLHLREIKTDDPNVILAACRRQISQHSSHTDLIGFDLDGTTFQTKGFMGSDPFYTAAFKAHKSNTPSLGDACVSNTELIKAEVEKDEIDIIRFFTNWVTDDGAPPTVEDFTDFLSTQALFHVDVEPTGITHLINEFGKFDHEIFSITARAPAMRMSVEKHLNQVGVNFKENDPLKELGQALANESETNSTAKLNDYILSYYKTALPHIYNDPDLQDRFDRIRTRAIDYKDGIAAVDGASKGLMLEFLRHAYTKTSEANPNSGIFFIDDVKKNLDDIKFVFEKINPDIDLTLIHYTGTSDLQMRFEKALADGSLYKEWEAFLRKINRHPQKG